MTPPLRIALPKGRLLSPALALFDAAGCDVPAACDARALRIETATADWIFVRGADVPVYVAHGAADAGITGLDQLEESGVDVDQPVELPFGRCRMMLIARRGTPPLDGASARTIATKFPRIARNRLGSRSALSEIVPLHGSVELALVLHLADYVVDLVETGATIRAHGLEPLELIGDITPRLIVNRESRRFRRAAVNDLIARLETAIRTAMPADRAERPAAREEIGR